jgi:hypothetical protein
MSSGVLTSPPTATARLVVDTDVASYIFKLIFYTIAAEVAQFQWVRILKMA